MDNQILKVNIAIYGKLSNDYGGKHIAILDEEMPSGASLGDLCKKIRIPLEETSFIFLDAVLCDMPGLSIDHTEALKDGSHIGIFSKGYMWPYQYRHDIQMSEPLKKAIGQKGDFHHSYENV